MSDVEAPVIATFLKGGVTPIEISLRRTGVGIEVGVKTIPEVEDFMKQLGGGRKIGIDGYGRAWQPMKGAILEAYDMYEAIDGENGAYRLDALNSPLNYDGYANLSFLRLAGTSEGAGITFFVKGVQSLPALRTLRDKIAAATKMFFIDYLRPVDMVIKISTQEVRL